jgi:sortase A
MSQEKTQNKNKSSYSYYLNLAGEVLIVFSLMILFFTYGPAAKQEIVYQAKQAFAKDDKDLEKEITPPNKEFSIVIPKIGASSPVFANVNPFDEKEYLPVLRKGVAHAKWSSLPGRLGNTYLFAHSTDAFYNVGRYNAVFYLLGKLEKGDAIYIYYNGEKYVYRVSDKKVVDAKDVFYLGKSGRSNTLTLQTCYPPGTTLKRLVVVAYQEDGPFAFK